MICMEVEVDIDAIITAVGVAVEHVSVSMILVPINITQCILVVSMVATRVDMAEEEDIMVAVEEVEATTVTRMATTTATTIVTVDSEVAMLEVQVVDIAVMGACPL